MKFLLVGALAFVPESLQRIGPDGEPMLYPQGHPWGCVSRSPAFATASIDENEPHSRATVYVAIAAGVRRDTIIRVDCAR